MKKLQKPREWHSGEPDQPSIFLLDLCFEHKNKGPGFTHHENDDCAQVEPDKCKEYGLSADFHELGCTVPSEPDTEQLRLILYNFAYDVDSDHGTKQLSVGIEEAAEKIRNLLKGQS